MYTNANKTYRHASVETLIVRVMGLPHSQRALLKGTSACPGGELVSLQLPVYTLHCGSCSANAHVRGNNPKVFAIALVGKNQ